MQFKPLVGNLWSVRIGDHYRAVAQKHGDLVVWFWIGTHEDYNNSSGSFGDPVVPARPAVAPYHCQLSFPAFLYS